MKESSNLEFKEIVTKSFLKTVSAFANYNGGTIIFGIDDKGNVKGINDKVSSILSIENMINDNIKPQVNYFLSLNEKDKTIVLEVKEGSEKPYFYNNKAYKRNDNSTIEVDILELKSLILESKNTSFIDLKSNKQDLTFSYLSRLFKEKVKLSNFDLDTLKTLNLYNEEGFSNCANLLSDENKLGAIDVAIFGDNINIIKKRVILENISILEMFDKVMEIFKDYYEYEEINDSYRKKVNLIPLEAFREALANAIIHRLYDNNIKINVAMFNEKIIVTSPGGLRSGITKDDYLNKIISIRRNETLANVFYRLGIIEMYGTGILRIKNSYLDSVNKPSFNISDNFIEVSLPLFSKDLNLSKDENNIYKKLSKNFKMDINDISNLSPFGRTKTTKILNSLNEKGIINIEGRGKATKYFL